MAEAPESKLLDGARSWAASPAAFQTVPDPTRPARYVDAVWYDTVVDKHEGAFCLVRDGAGLDDLKGEIVQIEVGSRKALVYCVGASREIPTDVAVQRVAFFRLAPLDDQAAIVVRATL